VTAFLRLIAMKTQITLKVKADVNVALVIFAASELIDTLHKVGLL